MPLTDAKYREKYGMTRVEMKEARKEKQKEYMKNYMREKNKNKKSKAVVKRRTSRVSTRRKKNEPSPHILFTLEDITTLELIRAEVMVMYRDGMNALVDRVRRRNDQG